MPAQRTCAPARCASGQPVALSDARLLSALATLRDALTPGQALNVPTVLDRSALLTCLSVLLTNSALATQIPAPAPAVAPSWKRLRSVRGWSQFEVYRRLRKVAADEGVGLPDWLTFKRNLCRWESGTVTASPFYAGLLARLFGLPEWTLVHANPAADLW